MEFDLNQALFQARKVSDLASTLRNNKSSLTSLKSTLNHNWKGSEMVHTNHAIDTMVNELTRLANQLEALEHDISVSAIEIKREIAAAKAAAEAEAKAAAAKGLGLK